MKESSEFNKEMNKCNSYDKYVGMDVHKNSISVAVAAAGRGEARFYGKIDNRPEAIRRLISALAPSGQRLHYCYEAGPCGYGICRQIRDTEHDCDLVAPSMTPRKSGDRVKTDRRDGLTLARLDRTAWAYRFPARRSRLIQRRAEKASAPVQAIAWKAQVRLCGRFRKLRDNGKHANVVVTAIARELLGFIWAIVIEQTRTQQEKQGLNAC